MEQGERTLPEGLDSLVGKRVYIETYGCRYNFGDTAKLKEILRSRNCSLVTSEEQADAVIINTCTVVAPTERRMLRRLARLRNHTLYVTGCMAVVQQEAIRAVCTPEFILPAAIQEQYSTIGTVAPEQVGIVQIAHGCNGACTYCITRKARGSLSSAPLRKILNQITALAGNGAVEIQLTAQDVSAWGRDLGMTLPALLDSIGQCEGRFLVRAGMMNPATVIDILDELVDAFAADNLFKFIHLPVQSGSDRVLETMGRGYSRADFEQIVAAFRRRYPGMTVATDMIVGFPSEDEDDFRQSLDLIRRLRFNKVNVTRFSRRPFTPAFSSPDIPDAVKKDRSRTMQAYAEEIYREILAPYVGSTLPFTVTEQIRTGSVMARTNSYLGIVLNEELPAGATGMAEILQESRYFLKGKRLSSGIAPVRRFCDYGDLPDLITVKREY